MQGHYVSTHIKRIAWALFVGQSRAVGTIAAMAATPFSNYLTCDIQNAIIKLATLQYTFLGP